MNEVPVKKKFLMGAVIGIIFLVIFILWGLNLKNVWRNNKNNDSPSTEWLSLKGETGKALAETQNKLDKIKKAKAIAKKEAEDKFLSGLLENTEKIASSSFLTATSSTVVTGAPSLIASSSSIMTGSLSAENCPKHIDCSPVVGDSEPCVIPFGCEGITLIAY